MPSKKKKYNARFPAGRIKKIMQTDEEVGKVAQAVPVIISRTLELFVESLLTKTLRITNARNAKTLSPSHMKQCIISESRFDFLRDLVKNIPDIGVNEEQLSGSETGYGTEAGASPASTSTSSSNGAVAAHGTSGHSETVGGGSGITLHRSESYTQSISSYPVPTSSGQLSTSTQPAPAQPPSNTLKRTLNHLNNLNFYKEISLDECSSSNREPPPKLSRLNSAPASTAAASSSIPIKIDILPNIQGASASSSGRPQQPASAGCSTASNNNNFKITYKIGSLSTEGSSSTATPAVADQPIIKLDYSNLKLPMTITADQPKHPIQPTIKIDLSSISNFSATSQQQQLPQSPALMGTNVSLKQVPSTPTASTPSTPLSALSSSSSSSSASSSKNPYTFQTSSGTACSFTTTPVAAPASIAPTSSGTAAPIYSVVSSAIPGMDEDYDDI